MRDAPGLCGYCAAPNVAVYAGDSLSTVICAADLTRRHRRMLLHL